MNANGMGDYAEEYWKSVSACQESADVHSLHCVFDTFQGFRVYHEGKLAWGIKSEGEIWDEQQHLQARSTKFCGSCWNPFNWSCCSSHGADDNKTKYYAPNPISGKQYQAGGTVYKKGS